MNGGEIMNEQVTFTIFGGTGDLAYRKLLPAFYNLYANQAFQHAKIVVLGRRPYDHEQYCTIIKDWVMQFARLPYRETLFQSFCEKISYVCMDFTKEEAYDTLAAFYKQHQDTQHIFYFAVAPRFFSTIAQGLLRVPHAKQGRVVIEKPFGEDRKSAKRLNEQLESFFKASHIYHIDHYLGKEMVRNIQTIRFLNPLFANVWNHECIAHVQISAMEEVGVETHGTYYDQSGALKDMVQNHLFQILSILAMEPLEAFTQEDLHEKQLTLLQQLRPVDQLNIQDTMVLGQYFGYQKEAHVAHDSTTETFAALRLYIDNERWQNTPFLIRTGKKLNKREMEVVITFKAPFPNVEPNVLIIKIQPTEGVYVRFNIKKPGNSEEILPVSMDFCQSCSDIHRINTPEAYERLLQAVWHADTSWFSSWDQIETSWAYVDALKERYENAQLPVYIYPSGSEGPQASYELFTMQPQGE